MYKFLNDISLQKQDGNCFKGELSPDWQIGPVLNGGYLMAMAAKVMAEVLPHPDPLTLNAYFLAPGTAGPVTANYEILRIGKGTSYGVVRLLQNDQIILHVTCAFAELNTLNGYSQSLESNPPITSFGNTPVCEMTEIDATMFNHTEFRYNKEVSGEGTWHGWISHPDNQTPDLFSLIYFADAYPPAVFNLLGNQGWVPTIELNIQLRARPAPGPVQVRFETQHISNGILEEDGTLWDSEGKLVAISRQTAKLRLKT